RVFTTAVVAGGRATKRFATSRSTARSCDRICARVREQEDARRRQQRDEERDDCRSAVSKRKTQRDDTSLCREPTSIDDCQTQHTPAESRANWQPRTPHKAQLAPTTARVSAAVAASSSYRRRTAFFAAYRAPSCTNCEKFPFLQTRCGPSREKRIAGVTRRLNDVDVAQNLPLNLDKPKILGPHRIIVRDRTKLFSEIMIIIAIFVKLGTCILHDDTFRKYSQDHPLQTKDRSRDRRMGPISLSVRPNVSQIYRDSEGRRRCILPVKQVYKCIFSTHPGIPPTETQIYNGFYDPNNRCGDSDVMYCAC
ncbi:hypothetical protein HN011_005277, partial [Eciton burchellii]